MSRGVVGRGLTERAKSGNLLVGGKERQRLR